MWAYIGALAYGDVVLRTRKAKHCTARAQPAILLPADAESVAALRETIGLALYERAGKPEGYDEMFLNDADAVLSALGLTPATGRKGKS